MNILNQIFNLFMSVKTTEKPRLYLMLVIQSTIKGWHFWGTMEQENQLLLAYSVHSLLRIVEIYTFRKNIIGPIKLFWIKVEFAIKRIVYGNRFWFIKFSEYLPLLCPLVTQATRSNGCIKNWSMIQTINTKDSAIYREETRENFAWW